MILKSLREEVLEANLELVRRGLAPDEEPRAIGAFHPAIGRQVQIDLGVAAAPSSIAPRSITGPALASAGDGAGLDMDGLEWLHG